MIARKLFLLLLACAALAQKKPVTIDTLAARPHERAGFESIVWAPDGKRFAFLRDSAIWQYDVPSGQSKELIALARLEEKAVKGTPPQAFEWLNRGVREQTFQWSSSGKEMLISAGGDLFLLHLDTGAWEQLTATPEPERDPKLSPDARRLAFRRGHDLYCLHVASRQLTELTHDHSDTLWNGELDWVYPEELDLATAYWWSPDSQHIAYLQFDVSRELIFPQVDLRPARARLEPQRFPQPGTPNADVRLGVVPATGGETRWMNLGETRDHLLARVDWAPDGQALAVQRLNRIQNRLVLSLADAYSGEARSLWREQDPYWINVNDDFRFFKNGRQLLWGSERDGYHHLYLHSLDGKHVTQLTRGEWEVTDVAGVDEAAQEVFFVSTEPSPLERHLYRVRFDGSHKTRLTATPGTHSVSMSPTCEYYLDTASSLTSPPRRTLHRRDGSQVAVYREAAPQEYEILLSEIVKVKSSDGALLYAHLIKPAGFVQGKKYPVIVMIYGGPHTQTVRDSWYGANWDQALAQRGFVIWQLDNRGSSGRGHAWESKVFRNLGALELRDQQEGIRYLEALGFADTSRMGIHGWSYGGYMTLYALLNAPRLFRAGIAGAPVTDWRNYDTIYTERYMGLPQDNAEAYQRSSPIPKAAELSAKLLLLHNYEDDNVHFQNTLQMAEALERAGKQFEMLVYPQKSHAVSGPLRKQMLEGMTAFFEKNLR